MSSDNVEMNQMNVPWTSGYIQAQGINQETLKHPVQPVWVTVKVKKLHPDAKSPEYAHTTDSCFDIFSVERVELPPDGLRKIHTGIAIQAPEGYDFQYEDKSGLAAKGVSVRGGTIDAGYTGELQVILVNEGDLPIMIEPGMKITQVRIQRRHYALFVDADELEPRDRGANGFGSTGLSGRPQ